MNVQLVYRPSAGRLRSISTIERFPVLTAPGTTVLADVLAEQWPPIAVSAVTGEISTVAQTAPLTPLGIEYDASGNLFMASFGGYQINRIDAVTGVSTRIAGTGNYGFGADNVPAFTWPPRSA